jgi:UDP-N-acetylglucosamine:LPS N-acetylglucosamine transferase
LKPVVVFLVKNGIGYGHIRRALVLAEALQEKGKVRPIVVSQAHSVHLFDTTSVPVVNFPLLQHLPNDIAADWYTSVLDQVLDQLDPALVVEDTYPDPRYLALPALRHRRRVLVLRRLDGLSFDTIRESGHLAAYDRILIAQNPEAFEMEGHSGETRTAVELSDRFSFVGQIYRQPNPLTVMRLRRHYRRMGQFLVVVSAGAGGDQRPDGYGDRLFDACVRVAKRMARGGGAGAAAQFVLVTGPYYAGRPVPERDNLTVVSFEPRLPELLAAADVAVIKPGHNGVSEALCGGGRLVLVPDASFMEGLDEHCRRITERYGGVVAAPDAEVLESAVRAALFAPPRTERLGSCDAAVAEAIHLLIEATEPEQVTIPERALVLLLRPPDGTSPDALRAMLLPSLAGAHIVGADVALLAAVESGSEQPSIAVLVDSPPTLPHPGPLLVAGVRLVFGGQKDAAFDRWRRMPVAGPALLVAHTTTAIADPAHPHRLYRHLEHGVTHCQLPVVELDLCRLHDVLDLRCYLAEISEWLACQPLRLLPLDRVAALLAGRLLDAAA